MNKCAVVIENDLFGIAARLREIDDGYFVVYDKAKHCFEVHNRLQRGDTFALRVPYPSLDARTVALVRRTRAERAEELLRETERENERLSKRTEREALERAAEKISEVGRGEK